MFSVSGYAHLMTNPVYYGQLRLYGHEIDAESHSQKGIVGSVLRHRGRLRFLAGPELLWLQGLPHHGKDH